MECGECNVSKELHINTESNKICVECILAHGFIKKSEIILKNDVLFFIRMNAERAGRDNIVKLLAIEYDRDEVTAAKEYLLKSAIVKLTEANQTLAKEVGQCRKGSKMRTKLIAEGYDIHDMLDALGGNVDVMAIDPENVPSVNPETLLHDSVVARIAVLEDINKDLKLEVDQLKDTIKNLATPSPASGAVVTSEGATSNKVATTPTAISKKSLTKHQHQQISKAAVMSAATASAQAIQEGKTVQDATKVGEYAGEATAKTFAEMARNTVGRAGTSAGATAGGSNGTTTAAAGSGVSPGATGRTPQFPWETVGNKKKKTLANKAPYEHGKGSAMCHSGKSISIRPRAKPEYLSNECLVVAGLNPELTEDELKAEIIYAAGRDIDFKFIQILSGEDQWYLTVAIELNEEDYKLLFDPNFWDPHCHIRKFLGNRWWRGERKGPRQPQKRLTYEQRKNMARAQWGRAAPTDSVV